MRRLEAGLLRWLGYVQRGHSGKIGRGLDERGWGEGFEVVGLGLRRLAGVEEGRLRGLLGDWLSVELVEGRRLLNWGLEHVGRVAGLAVVGSGGDGRVQDVLGTAEGTGRSRARSWRLV